MARLQALCFAGPLVAAAEVTSLPEREEDADEVDHVKDGAELFPTATVALLTCRCQEGWCVERHLQTGQDQGSTCMIFDYGMIGVSP